MVRGLPAILPRIVCLQCMRDVSVTYSELSQDYATDTMFIVRVVCHEARIARLHADQVQASQQSGRPILFEDLLFINFDHESVEGWEAQATRLMDRVRIVTEHFRAGGK